MPNLSSAPELTVIIVSYNTRDLTLRAIETLLDNAGEVALEVIVWDNASTDGSAEAIAARFPEVMLVAHQENIGFARANNAAADRARGAFLLLLNPDTETQDGAISSILRFALAHPEAGIVGGRTVFPDGSLNPTSCWNRMTVWSLFCSASGLTKLFPASCLLNSEAIGCWQRDSERHVDIVTGCFLMIGRSLWEELGGFDETFFMYGEDADLCLRAKKLGCRPMITPDAQIMHLVGAAAHNADSKRMQVLRGKATLILTHWRRPLARVGIALLMSGVLLRLLLSSIASPFRPNSLQARAGWRYIWDRREDWAKGYR